jgi:hypothetical protein
MWGAEGEILVANGRTLTNICANWPRRGGLTNQREYCMYAIVFVQLASNKLTCFFSSFYQLVLT